MTEPSTDGSVSDLFVFVIYSTYHLWYVDDNKLSYVDPNIVTDILEEMKKHFDDMVISRGDTHDLLDITIKIIN